MPYAVYHGNHVWGVGYTQNSAVNSANEAIEWYNSQQESFNKKVGYIAGYRKRVKGMYIVYITKTIWDRMEREGYDNAARRFNFTDRKVNRNFIRLD